MWPTVMLHAHTLAGIATQNRLGIDNELRTVVYRASIEAYACTCIYVIAYECIIYSFHVGIQDVRYAYMYMYMYICKI